MFGVIYKPEFIVRIVIQWNKIAYPFLALLCRIFNILLLCVERVVIVNSRLATKGSRRPL